MIPACHDCGRPIAGRLPRVKRCLDCAWKRRLATNRATRHRTIAAGECQRCGSSRGENGTAHHCRPCAVVVNATHVARRAWLQFNGKCGVCGFQAQPGRRKCERCAKIDARAQARRSATA
jgi:hypothetical protein